MGLHDKIKNTSDEPGTYDEKLYRSLVDDKYSSSSYCRRNLGESDEQAVKNAFELYHKAYLYGFLQPRGAVEVLNYRDNNQLYEGFPFSNEEMDNLDRFYSKEYRIHFKASCVVEEYVIEEVVEYDDDPVVLESEAYK